MPPGPMNRLVEHLRRVVGPTGGARLTDAELLERFITDQDEAAFEALLRRHAPMVLGVCRRILGHADDAEDAFQATFLVLVRKATSIRPRDAVGNWLYGVAYRTALEARVRLARRRAREHQVPIMPQREVEPESGWQDVRPVLDRELSALPDKYRLPVVLCDLEGRGRREVARQLRIPEGTLSSRLATARKMLAIRLTRRGVALSAGGLAVLLAQNGASAYVPASLFVSTTNAALLLAAGPAVAAGIIPAKVAALSEGVVKMMFLAKLKMTAVVCAGVAAVGLGTGGLLYQARAANGDPVHVQTAPNQLVQRNARPDDDDDDKPRQRSQDRQSSAREQELRRELERARAEVQAARRQAEAARHQAEQAMRQARSELERARQEARAQRDHARAAEQQARHAANQERIARANKEKNHKHDMHDQSAEQQGGRDLAEQLNRARSEMLKNFDRQRQQLTEQLKRLDQVQQRSMRQLEEQLSRAHQRLMGKNNKSHSTSSSSSSASSGDKLDQILQRLERMERRIDRLESGNRQSNDRKRERR
ncbi:MAG TPA: sigma-70 family RNA polymerase sigma factor [Gemmataceae bacterium]|nr:sigma-70 family RNA polymerase sigma factor [Gemmataceae bacterium]